MTQIQDKNGELTYKYLHGLTCTYAQHIEHTHTHTHTINTPKNNTFTCTHMHDKYTHTHTHTHSYTYAHTHKSAIMNCALLSEIT